VNDSASENAQEGNRLSADNIVYRHSIFKADPFGHGGEKRSAQLVDLLSQRGIREYRLRFRSDDANIPWHLALQGALLNGFTRRRLNRQTLSKVMLQGADRIRLEQRVRGMPTSPLVLWEATHQRDSVVLGWAEANGCKVVALPQNLESLVPGQASFFTNKKSPHWLIEEVQMLRRCESVYCISREEQWLLGLHGIDARFLPYFPCSFLEAQLLSIRARRRDSVKQGFLVLGTARNYPTFLGMTRLIDQFSVSRSSCGPVFVAGFGTEKLQSKIDAASARLTLLGSLSHEELDELLVGIRAVVIYQPPSTGVLVKVVESLVAGVPVLCNESAARSQFDRSGVLVYRTFGELDSMMDDWKDIEPSVPSPPVLETEMLLDDVTRLLGRDG
jgi:hypothetical protein